jgi:sulfur carrier protein ThiS
VELYVVGRSSLWRRGNWGHLQLVGSSDAEACAYACGRMRPPMVNIFLRTQKFEVRSGMSLLSALQKIDVLPESVIATREGEMILEDEILKEGDEIKLVAVISGG